MEQSPNIGFWKGIVLGAILNVSVFSGLALYSATVRYMVVQETNPHITWSLIFARHVTGWLPVMLLAPPVFWLARLFRPTPAQRFRPLLAHLGASMVWEPVRCAIYAFASLRLAPWPENAGQGFWGSFRFALFSDYYWYWILAICAFAWYTFLDYLGRTREAAELGRRNAELSEQLARAELQALKAQIQPHFLFNTHNAIAGLIRAGEKSKALQALSDLSSLFRYTLETRNREMARLGEEMAFLDHYLKIQMLRFGDRLAVTVTVSEEAREAQIPAMTLQPLVENAVHHGGAAHRPQSTVTLDGRISQDRLIFVIRNSFDPDAPDSSGFGIGLANVKARLTRYYADSYSLDLELLEGDEMQLTLEIPKHPPERTEA